MCLVTLICTDQWSKFFFFKCYYVIIYTVIYLNKFDHLCWFITFSLLCSFGLPDAFGNFWIILNLILYNWLRVCYLMFLLGIPELIISSLKKQMFLDWLNVFFFFLLLDPETDLNFQEFVFFNQFIPKKFALLRCKRVRENG